MGHAAHLETTRMSSLRNGFLLGMLLLACAPAATAQTAYGETFRAGWEALEDGQIAAARTAFERCLELVPENSTSAYYLACTHARGGDLQRAEEWLVRAVDRGWSETGTLSRDTDLAPIRDQVPGGVLARRGSREEKPESRRLRSSLPDFPYCDVDGWSLVTSWAGRPPFVQWDLRSGRILGITHHPERQPGYLIARSDPQDQDVFVAGSGLTVTLEDRNRFIVGRASATGQSAWQIHKNRGFRGQWVSLPALGVLATALWGGGVLVFDVETGREVRHLSSAHLASRAVSNPTGALQASTVSDGTTRLWSTIDGTDVKILRGPPELFGPRSFDRSGELYAVGGWDGVVRLWEVDSGRLLHELKVHPNQVASASFSPDGTKLLTSGYDYYSTGYRPAPKLWDTASGELIATLECDPGRLNGIGWSPDGMYVAAGGSSGATYVWSGETGGLVELMDHGSIVYDLAWSPDSRFLALGHKRETVRIVDAEDWSVRHELRNPTFGGDPIDDVVYDASGRYLAVGAGLEVFLWDMVTGKRLWMDAFNGGNMGGMAVAFSPDGKSLISSGRGRWVNRLYDVETGAQKHDLADRVLRTGSFTPDGRWIKTWSEDGGTRLLDPETSEIRFQREEFRGGASLRHVPAGYYEGDASAASNTFFQVDGKYLPLDGYASLLLDPKRVRASLDGADLQPVDLEPPPELRVESPPGRFGRCDEGRCHLLAHAEDASRVLRFEVRVGADRVDMTLIDGATSFRDDGKVATLDWTFALAEGADVADVEIRAIGKRGVAGWPVLRTFHRSEKPPVLGD